MPSALWVVSCRNCNESFTYSEISEPQHAVDYLFPTKPEVAGNGRELQCPHCKSIATYQRTDLWYQAAAANSWTLGTPLPLWRLNSSAIRHKGPISPAWFGAIAGAALACIFFLSKGRPKQRIVFLMFVALVFPGSDFGAAVQVNMVEAARLTSERQPETTRLP